MAAARTFAVPLSVVTVTTPRVVPPSCVKLRITRKRLSGTSIDREPPGAMVALWKEPAKTEIADAQKTAATKHLPPMVFTPSRLDLYGSWRNHLLCSGPQDEDGSAIYYDEDSHHFRWGWQPLPNMHKAGDTKKYREQEKFLGPARAFVYLWLDGHAASQRGICCRNGKADRFSQRLPGRLRGNFSRYLAPIAKLSPTCGLGCRCSCCGFRVIHSCSDLRHSPGNCFASRSAGQYCKADLPARGSHTYSRYLCLRHLLHPA